MIANGRRKVMFESLFYTESKEPSANCYVVGEPNKGGEKEKNQIRTGIIRTSRARWHSTSTISAMKVLNSIYLIIMYIIITFTPFQLLRAQIKI